jgi:excisionase family DNA binding protein
MTAPGLQAQLQRLKRALDTHRQALEELESALLEFEEALTGESSVRPQSPKGLELLSIPEVCQELRMGKSWVYRNIRSGEIPSMKLGHNIKVSRQGLEAYLSRQRNRPSEEASYSSSEGEDR